MDSRDFNFPVLIESSQFRVNEMLLAKHRICDGKAIRSASFKHAINSCFNVSLTSTLKELSQFCK